MVVVVMVFMVVVVVMVVVMVVCLFVCLSVCLSVCYLHTRGFLAPSTLAVKQLQRGEERFRGQTLRTPPPAYPALH